MLSKSEIVVKANVWINQRIPEFEMVVLGDTLIEHKHCYSFSWCKKSEENLHWRNRTVWVGAGLLLGSKNGDIFDFAGSSPGVDWIYLFELQVQGLEEYWYLEIPFKKEYISKLKAAIKCSTMELLKMVDENQNIIYTEPKAWNDHFPRFQEIADDLNRSGVACEIQIKTRKKL